LWVAQQVQCVLLKKSSTRLIMERSGGTLIHLTVSVRFLTQTFAISKKSAKISCAGSQIHSTHRLDQRLMRLRDLTGRPPPARCDSANRRRGRPNGCCMWDQISGFLFDNYAVASRRQRSSFSAGTLLACGCGTRADRKIGGRPSPVDPEGQINPSESATANKPEIAAASIKS
jgi:hypothetical protein